MKTKTKTEDFQVSSGRILVGDPCYETNRGAKAMNGSWTAHVEMNHMGGIWGSRVCKVVVHHEDFDPTDPRIKCESVGFGVDSGQAGVFDEGSYGGDSFYEMCCKKTLSKKQAGYIKGGFVSSSGYGDGFYEAEIFKVNGVSVCVELTFVEK